MVSKLTTIDISPSIFTPQGEVFLNSSLLHQERKIFTPRRCESLLYFNYSLVGQKLAEVIFPTPCHYRIYAHAKGESAGNGTGVISLHFMDLGLKGEWRANELIIILKNFSLFDWEFLILLNAYGR